MTPKRKPASDNQPVRISRPAAAHIHCCICLNRTARKTPATTMVRGYAVCDAHIDLVAQPEFDIMTLQGKEIRPV